jgi:hypothetical protein
MVSLKLSGSGEEYLFFASARTTGAEIARWWRDARRAYNVPVPKVFPTALFRLEILDSVPWSRTATSMRSGWVTRTHQ